VIRIVGVAADARVATRTDNPVALAEASRWIAANALAARGYRVVVEGIAPRAGVVAVRCGRGPAGHRNLGAFADLLAALAAVPALVDPEPLPVTWRLALRALGIPLLTRGAPVLVVARDEIDAPTVIDVAAHGDAYRVRVTPRLLAA